MYVCGCTSSPGPTHTHARTGHGAKVSKQLAVDVLDLFWVLFSGDHQHVTNNFGNYTLHSSSRHVLGAQSRRAVCACSPHTHIFVYVRTVVVTPAATKQTNLNICNTMRHSHTHSADRQTHHKHTHRHTHGSDVCVFCFVVSFGGGGGGGVGDYLDH